MGEKTEEKLLAEVTLATPTATAVVKTWGEQAWSSQKHVEQLEGKIAHFHGMRVSAHDPATKTMKFSFGKKATAACVVAVDKLDMLPDEPYLKQFKDWWSHGCPTDGLPCVTEQFTGSVTNVEVRHVPCKR